MDSNNFIENYEKQYKKIRRMQDIGFVVICIVFLTLLAGMNIWYHTSGGNYLVVVFVLVLAFCGIGLYKIFISFKYQKNANSVMQRYKSELEIEWAFEVYRTLLKKKKRRDYNNLLAGYLNLLYVANRYEEFERNYVEYIKKPGAVNIAWLKIMKENFAAISKNSDVYIKTVFGHKFSKYFREKGTLEGIKAQLRYLDERYEIQQLFFQNEYERAIEKIDAAHVNNCYDQILLEMSKQNCLYYLGRKEEIVIPDAPEYMTYKLKHLLDNGVRCHYEEADAWIERIDKDIAKRKMVIKVLRIIAVILLLISFVLANSIIKGDGFRLEKNENVHSFVNEEVVDNDWTPDNVVENDIDVEWDVQQNSEKISEEEKAIEEEIKRIGNNKYDSRDGSMYSFYTIEEGWGLRVSDDTSGDRRYWLDYTTDGGNTWTTINEDPFAGKSGVVEGIAYVWGKYGYISISKDSGEYARVFRTEDGGYTFEEIVLPVEECKEMNPGEYQYYSMPEVSDEEIRITVRESRYHNKDGYVFKSEDRGKTWEYAGKVVDEFYYDKEE